MPSVTVDLDDLEKLVLTSGVMKAIEGLLAGRRNDPFVRQHLDFTEAHDRLATAMRNARRVDAGTLVAWDGELDDEEVSLLRIAEDGHLWLRRDEKAPKPGADMSVADRLMCKGCVVIGHFLTGVSFPGSQPELTVDPKGFPIRITDRGRDKLAKIAAAKKASASA